MKNIVRYPLGFWAALSVLLFLASARAFGAEHKGTQLFGQSGDAYVRQSGSRWMFGTSKVEKELVLKDGHLFLASFKNRSAHRDYIQGPSEAFAFSLNKVSITGLSRSWTLVKAQAESVTQVKAHAGSVAYSEPLST